jgi:phosphoribosylformylglycinamidine (FGAM) synthase PurS component
MPTHLFEIGYKPGRVDPVGQGLKADIEHLRLGKVKSVASAQLYKVTGSLSAANKTRIAEDLLVDPILNESRSRQITESKSIVVDVWYKTGVTDVVGESVKKGISDLDISGVEDVRTGMRYHLEGVTKREVAEKIALSLLANPLVHELTIHAD